LLAAWGIAACSKAPDPPADPYLADLRERLKRLQPEVEREIGCKLGEVELVVLPRERIVEAKIPRIRTILSRIENGPQGEELDEQAREAAKHTSEIVAATVDAGRIVFLDSKLPDPEMLQLDAPFEFARDPRAADVYIVHELVHVHQHRHLVKPGFLESARSRADILARTAVLEGHAEYVTRKVLTRVGCADLYDKYLEALGPDAKATHFAYSQGEEFVDSVVRKLGYDEAVHRIFASPPALTAVSLPDEYFSAGGERSRWGPVFEDLRRWLARECGSASLRAVALPLVREVAGDAADGFREGFIVSSAHPKVRIHVLVAASEKAAGDLHAAWTQGLERYHQQGVAKGRAIDIRLVNKPDDWMLHYATWEGHVRDSVIRGGCFVLDAQCSGDSEAEEGAERLAHRALRFLTDESWRTAWLKGDKELLTSGDAGLRLAAVSRLKKYVPDDDWETRWLGRWHEANDTARSEDERGAVLIAAIKDPHPGVVARGLRAARGMYLWGELPWPLLREKIVDRVAAVRCAAWGLMDCVISYHDRPSAWQAPRDEALRLVRNALEDEDVVVRAEAADCLGSLVGTPGLSDAFRKALSDDVPWIRSGALISLAVRERLQMPELTPQLVDLLATEPEHAAKALGNLGPAAAEALPTLRGLLSDPKRRAPAAYAIWKITSDPEPLFEAVRESVARGVPDGIEELGEMEATARPLVPDVAKGLDASSRWVRFTAAKALGRIGGASAKHALERRLAIELDPNVREGIRSALNGRKD